MLERVMLLEDSTAVGWLVEAHLQAFDGCWVGSHIHGMLGRGYDVVLAAHIRCAVWPTEDVYLSRSTWYAKAASLRQIID